MIRIFPIFHYGITEFEKVDVKTLVSDASVLFIEETGDSNFTEFYYNRIANGARPDTRSFGQHTNFWIKFERYLYNSKKQIHVEHPSTALKSTDLEERLPYGFCMAYVKGKPEDAFVMALNFFHGYANRNIQREREMVKAISEIEAQHEDGIVLAVLGEMHSLHVADALQKLGCKVEITAGAEKQILFFREAYDAFHSGSEPDKLTIARAVPETLLRTYLSDLLAYDIIEGGRIANDFARKLDYESSRQLSRKVGNINKGADLDVHDATANLVYLLEEQGLLKL